MQFMLACRANGSYHQPMKNLAGTLALLLSLTFGTAHDARADQNDPRLDQLFVHLQGVDTSDQARLIEQLIWDVWLESKSPTLKLLMGRVVSAMGQQKFDDALKILHSVVTIEPNYAEGWNKRATVYFLLGRYEESIVDVERTLALEPRHFGALSGLGLIYTYLRDNAGALDAYERALKVNPHLGQAKTEVKRLRRKVKGENI
ncbi:MAG: tetratricopeptide repeat protein [Proteobacteria bacterium]|nr:tetratricopeptide repeat protein [Pseudomonadota bacterium]